MKARNRLLIINALIDSFPRRTWHLFCFPIFVTVSEAYSLVGKVDMILTEKSCIPCESMARPLKDAEEEGYHRMVEWEIDRTGIHQIRKIFTFRNFKESIAFVNEVAFLAEQERHLPEIHVRHRKVIIELHTHAVLGLTENDFIMAAKIDKIAGAAG
jgi:4a-hydroxytetrahydrobiopterin dehydratase